MTTPSISIAPTRDVPAGVHSSLVSAPFSFTNWGYPDLLISYFPTSLEQLRDQSDTVVVARLLAAEIEPRPDGIFVLPINSDGTIPEDELQAVHLVFEVSSVIGGLAYPHSRHADNSIDVYISYDAGGEYVDLLNTVTDRAIQDGTNYLLFLRNVRVGSSNGAVGERTSYYTVDPSTHEVYAFDGDGTVARVEPGFVLQDVEPTASTDEVAAVLRGGLNTVRLSLVHDESRIHFPRAADVIETLTVTPGTHTTERTRFFDERLSTLPYPDATHEVVP